MKKILPLLLILLSACATHYSYAPSSGYKQNSDLQITDEEIQKAFDARPQIRKPSAVAWYTWYNVNTDADELLRRLHVYDNSIVSTNYDIPGRLFGSNTPENHLKTIRLLAAQAKCDILVLVSSNVRFTTDHNSWGWLNILLIPALFTPYIDIAMMAETEIMVFDVRNGYLYRHATFKSDTIRKNGIKSRNVIRTLQDMSARLMEEAADNLRRDIISVLQGQ